MFVPNCLPSACHKSGALWESLASLRAIYLIDLEPSKLQQTQDKTLVSKTRPACTPHILLKGPWGPLGDLIQLDDLYSETTPV